MYGGEGAGASPVYFQEWADGKATINYGVDGLQALDKVVRAAEQTGIKLIMALTNNWADYGGMDVYTVNLGGIYHVSLAIEDRHICIDLALFLIG